MLSRGPVPSKLCGAWVIRVIVLMSLLSLAPPLQATPYDSDQEGSLKSAFIYNFIRYIVWPDPGSGLQDPDLIRIFVVGEDEPWHDLMKMGSLTNAAGKPIRVEEATLNDNLAQAQIVVITTHEKPTLARILALLADSPTLTISDADDFAELGTMINFFIVEAENGNRKVKFEINHHAAVRANLKISAHLLTLARLVETEVDPK